MCEWIRWEESSYNAAAKRFCVPIAKDHHEWKGDTISLPNRKKRAMGEGEKKL